MLLRFGVANFRSIRNYQELQLTASARINRKQPAMHVPVLREAAVPVVAIYGANASGKSNLVAALGEMRRHIVKSHKSLDATDPISREHFRLDSASATKPTRFDCTFAIKNAVAEEEVVVYEYGFEFTDQEYGKEWLLCTVRRQRQTTRTLFERKTVDGEVEVRFGGQLQGENRTIANLTRPNSLFLSAAAQNNHPQLSKVHQHFTKNWTVLSDRASMNDFQLAEHLDGYPYAEQLLSVVRQADLGIVGADAQAYEPDNATKKMHKKMVEIVIDFMDEKEPNRGFSVQDMEDSISHLHRFQFIHSGMDGEDRPFSYDLESQGTRTLVSLLIPAFEALSSGSLLVIDELDSSLHPRLVRAFASLFKGGANSGGAQLIFSTHDVALLDVGLLERDEIWMAEKARDGASAFTPLTDYRLRSRDDIEKAYRHGRVGGVPASSDFTVDFGG